jgi:hypothetical protein
VSEFLGWEFINDSTEPAVTAGSAEFRVGNKSVYARFESFSTAHDVFRIIEKAYKSGRYDGIADVKRRVSSIVESIE